MYITPQFYLFKSLNSFCLHCHKAIEPFLLLTFLVLRIDSIAVSLGLILVAPHSKLLLPPQERNFASFRADKSQICLSVSPISVTIQPKLVAAGLQTSSKSHLHHLRRLHLNEVKSPWSKSQKKPLPPKVSFYAFSTAMANAN